ncbi:MAG: hypothetical protein ACQGVC_25785 [Myxococcota bacterium]
MADESQAVGLCARCLYGATQANARGSVFWRCLAADANPEMLRYPPLPVTQCDAFRDRATQEG